MPPFAAQGVAAPSDFPYVDLLKEASELDHDDYVEPPHIAPSSKRTAEDAFSEDDASSDDSDSPSPLPQTRAAPSLPKQSRRNGRTALYKKQQRQQAYNQSGHQTSERAYEKYLRNAASIPADIHLPDLPATSCGYQAKNSDGSYKAAVPDLTELLLQGFKYEKWDGSHNKVFTTGEEKRVFLACIGIPTHKDFEGVMERAGQAIVEAEKRATFKAKELRHRRGGYGQVTTGVSYGVGRTAATNLKHKRHDKIIAELLQNKDIQRIAGFASAAFKMCAPRLYEEYRVTFNKIFDAMPTLSKNFANSVWTAAGVNMGPGVATFPHRDSLNLPYGWCAVQALGCFDHTKGGHLVLYELGLILEFPAGSLILLPSATLTHANTPIQDGEVRVSFVQFTPGGIFRYVDNGFRTEGQFKAQDKAGYEEMMKKKKTRWEEGLKKLSTLDELRSGKGTVGAGV